MSNKDKKHIINIELKHYDRNWTKPQYKAISRWLREVRTELEPKIIEQHKKELKKLFIDCLV